MCLHHSHNISNNKVLFLLPSDAEVLFGESVVEHYNNVPNAQRNGVLSDTYLLLYQLIRNYHLATITSESYY